jgi:hypothetical protein
MPEKDLRRGKSAVSPAGGHFTPHGRCQVYCTLSPFQRRISGEEKVLCHQLAAILLNMTSGISTLFLFQRRISGEVKVLCHLLVAILLHMTAAKSTLSTFRRRISGEEKVLCHMLVAILRTQHGLCQVYPLPIPQRDLR